MSEMKLHYGRPDNMEGREEREVRTYDFLDSLGIEYWQTDHERRADSMEDCREIDAVLEATICKNLFLCNRQKTEFYLLMMPGEKPFKTKEIPPQIGCARLSFAPEEKMVEFLDIHPGAVSVMGLMNDREGGGNPAGGRGCAAGGIHGMPSLRSHLQPEDPAEGPDGGFPAGGEARLSDGGAEGGGMRRAADSAGL